MHVMVFILKYCCQSGTDLDFWVWGLWFKVKLKKIDFQQSELYPQLP